jgi:hypothetical protein
MTSAETPVFDAAVQRSHGPGAWLFDSDRSRITVRNADVVLAHLPLFLAGWPLRWSGPAGDAPCDIELRADGGGIALTRAGAGAQHFADALAAANGLAEALVDAFLARATRTICLPAAAVAIGRGLALLLGGPDDRSSVALDLAARGYTLFGADRIGLRIASGGSGICLGLMPSMRLPLPADADHRTAAFVEAFSVLQTEKRAYLRPAAGVMAEFAEERPVSAVFLLRRVARGGARILAATCEDIAAAEPALAPLAGAVPGFRLPFANSPDAAAAAVAALGSGAGR